MESITHADMLRNLKYQRAFSSCGIATKKTSVRRTLHAGKESVLEERHAAGVEIEFRDEWLAVNFCLLSTEAFHLPEQMIAARVTGPRIVVEKMEDSPRSFVFAVRGAVDRQTVFAARAG